jgi:hypothetical protein
MPLGNLFPCTHCGEDVNPETDEIFVYANGPVAHRECEMRAVLGSVAHLERRCGCFVPGSTENDPPGMTRREAARAAVALWRAQSQSPPD